MDAIACITQKLCIGMKKFGSILQTVNKTQGCLDCLIQLKIQSQIEGVILFVAFQEMGAHCRNTYFQKSYIVDLWYKAREELYFQFCNRGILFKSQWTDPFCLFVSFP